MGRMIYIESNLLPQEKIVYQGHRHWVVFLHSLFWVIAAVIIGLFFPGFTLIEAVILGLALWTGFTAFIFYRFSEVAVTNMRVIVKTGWIASTSTETLIQSIASIHVEQSFIGRILNYGTVVTLDKGSLRTPYRLLTAPFDFRRAVQMQIEQKTIVS